MNQQTTSINIFDKIFRLCVIAKFQVDVVSLQFLNYFSINQNFPPQITCNRNRKKPIPFCLRDNGIPEIRDRHTFDGIGCAFAPRGPPIENKGFR